MLGWVDLEEHAGGLITYGSMSLWLTMYFNAELNARLQRLGSRGTAPVLASRLLALLPGASVPAGSPAVAGHLLATATANLAQAAFGPLQPSTGRPALQPLLSALEVMTCFANPYAP